MNEMPGIFGRKVGMTQYFTQEGTQVPVTVVDTTGNVVLQVKTSDGADGYSALQIGLGDRKAIRTTKAQKGHFDKVGASPKQVVGEIRVGDDTAKATEAGSTLALAATFTVGDKVDVSGQSKGRGFAGVMKRHNFQGFIRSHGSHEYFRHGGSIGTRLTPGHVLKGKKMPGHMGAERVTVQNLEVVRIDDERNLLFIKGGIPGANGSIVTVRKAVKG